MPAGRAVSVLLRIRDRARRPRLAGMSTTRTRVPGALRPDLALARMDCAAALSARLDAVVTEAGRDPRRAADPRWWVAALAGPGRSLDDDWARLAGPPVRRARARSRSWRATGTDLRVLLPGARSGAVPDTVRRGPAVLADAAVAALPVPPPRRTPPRRTRGRTRRPSTRRRAPGAGLAGVAVSGSVLPGSLLSGSAVSGVVGVWRVLPGSGAGTLLVLAGVLLLAGAAVAARVRTVRAARGRALAERVGAAVSVAAERELVRRSLAAERAAATGPPRPDGVVAARRWGAGRAA